MEHNAWYLKKLMVTFSMCLGVMYSGENDVCGVTLSLSTPES